MVRRPPRGPMPARAQARASASPIGRSHQQPSIDGGPDTKKMQRTPEPELMDDREQAAAYAAEDWTESHGKIPGYFRERFPDFAGGRVIDLGCGTADVTIRFARAFPEVTVVGVDGSDSMLAFARKSVHDADLDSR